MSRTAGRVFPLGVVGVFILFLGSIFLVIAALLRDLHRRPSVNS
jgi:hypothetical protein